MQPIDGDLSHNEVIKNISAGDFLEIDTAKGERLTIIVESISNTHVQANSDRYALDEITILAHRKVSTADVAAGITWELVGKNLVALLIGGVIVAILLPIAL